MTDATIMVHAEAGAECDARLALAGDLADRFGAMLMGVAAESVLPPPMDPMGGAMGGIGAASMAVEAERERVEAELRAAEARFRAAVGGGGERRSAWRAFVGHPADALVREARAADLLVLGSATGASGSRGALRFPDPGTVLLAAGRPVLLVPPGTAALEARRAVVAWKDTREARRAASDALPLLARAEEVLVLEVCEADEESRVAAGPRVAAAAAAAAAHLARHGVKARAEARALGEPSVADALVLAAGRLGADLIVAGGYGHARLREWVFGGVTRDLLRRVPVCCLLSH